MLPVRPYMDCYLAGAGMVQLAPSSTPAQRPTKLRKIVVVGKATEDAWALASEVLMAHRGRKCLPL